VAESVNVVHPAHCAPGAEEAWKARVPGAEGYAHSVQEEDGEVKATLAGGTEA